MSSYAFNPQLPPLPQGEWTDAEYSADEAKLRADTINQYHDILRQLGYTDDAGNYIPGTVDVEANRRRGELGRSMTEAELGVTRNAQREGTLFSGIRADRTGEAQFPYRTDLSQLEEDVPKQLAGLYEQAGGLINDYTLGRNQLLAGAAQRYTPPAIADPVAAPVVAPVTAPGTAPALRTAIPAPKTVQRPYTGRNDPESGGIYWNDPDWRMSLPASQRPAMARGGIVDGPTDATIGEEGPEAVVPLKRGRAAAIAQLKRMLSGGGKSFGQGIDERNYTPPLTPGLEDFPTVRPDPGIAWGGQHFVDPEALVQWMNARGADTTEEQFLGNHPGVAAQYGERQAQPAQQQQQGIGGQQKTAVKAPPNVHSKGLKAAASILNELAKHHEQDHPIQTAPPPRPAQQSAARPVNPRAAAAARLRAAFPTDVNRLHGRS